MQVTDTCQKLICILIGATIKYVYATYFILLQHLFHLILHMQMAQGR